MSGVIWYFLKYFFPQKYIGYYRKSMCQTSSVKVSHSFIMFRVQSDHKRWLDTLAFQNQINQLNRKDVASIQYVPNRTEVKLNLKNSSYLAHLHSMPIHCQYRNLDNSCKQYLLVTLPYNHLPHVVAMLYTRGVATCNVVTCLGWK